MPSIALNTSSDETQVIVTGDINAILSSRRAMRFLQDNTFFSVEGNQIVFLTNGDTRKCIDRIQVVARMASCDIAIQEQANTLINSYFEEENRFNEFSQKAFQIRNNQCDLSDFTSFQNALKVYMKARTLYGLQVLSSYHMAFSQNSCNFSVPGAGKTSIVYGAYAYLKNLPPSSNKKVDKLLIIAPLNAFAAWEDEYKECFGVSPLSMRLAGNIDLEEKKQYFYSGKTAEITLLSYASIPSLSEDILFFLRKNKVMIVLDEAHKIKNTQGGIISSSIMGLAPYAASRIVLTGTPAPNGYEDLYNLFNFIWPGKGIIKFNTGQLRDMTRNIDDPRISKLISSVEPFFIRICKKDLNLPPAVEHPLILVPCKKSQRQIYDFIENRYMSDLAKDHHSPVKALLNKARLIRLMQAATNPALLSRPIVEFSSEQFDFSGIQDDSLILRSILHYSDNEIPAKFEVALRLIRNIVASGQKVVVWATFVKNIESLCSFLEEEGIPSRKLYGGTPIAGQIGEEDPRYSETRESIVREFNSTSSSFNVIIANPFAVSESISLHKACHNAIYLERTFNAAHFLQSKDRIHRYGLKDGIETHYYYLASSDSIDVTIHDRLQQKERRLMQIIESSSIPLFDNILLDSGDEDIKAVLRDYAKRAF